MSVIASSFWFSKFVFSYKIVGKASSQSCFGIALIFSLVTHDFQSTMSYKKWYQITGENTKDNLYISFSAIVFA